MRTCPRLFLAFLAAGLPACSDYGVSHSNLAQEAESAELTLAADGSAEVDLQLAADGAALGGHPSSFVDMSIFASRMDGAPVVTAAAGPESVSGAIDGLQFLDLEVEDVFAGCDDASAGGLASTADADGGCVVLLPVDLGVTGGGVSLQVSAHFELDFPSESPPGTITLTVLD